MPLAIGKYSEEWQEASNKIFRKARLSYSRMKDRKTNNKDIIYYELIDSEPFINMKRKKIIKKAQGTVWKSKVTIYTNTFIYIYIHVYTYIRYICYICVIT